MTWADNTQNGHPILGHFPRIFRDPSGEPQRDWIDNVPNDGVLYYRWLFNESRVLVTSPKALAEVLVQRNYEFVKPARIRKGLGRLLGVGILLAEGDEHKVCMSFVGILWHNYGTKLTSNSVRESSYRQLSRFVMSKICIRSSGERARR